MAADKIAHKMRSLIEEGKYSRAAELGESLALSHSNEVLGTSYFALLCTAHLATGSVPAARLAIVRGNGELGDKSLEFAGRLLAAREDFKNADAIGALRQAPPEVSDVLRDILVCELAATVAVIQAPAVVGDLCQLTQLSPEEVIACLKKAGKHFGVAVKEDGALIRVPIAADSAASKTSADAAAASSGTSQKSSVASVDLVTQAALMTAQSVDRHYANAK